MRIFVLVVATNDDTPMTVPSARVLGKTVKPMFADASGPLHLPDTNAHAIALPL